VRAEGFTVGHAGSGTSAAPALLDVTRSAPEALDITDEGAVGQVFADRTHVDHGLISAYAMLYGAIVNHGGSCPLLVPIVSSPSKVYIACRRSCVLRHRGNGQA
jgi:hypothetical protein